MFNLLSVCLPHIANRKSRSYPLYLSFTVSVSLSPLLSSRLKFFLLVNYQFNCSYLQTNLHLLGTCFCSDLSFSVSLSLSLSLCLSLSLVKCLDLICALSWTKTLLAFLLRLNVAVPFAQFFCLAMSKCDILLIDQHIFAPIRTTKHNGNGKLINQTDNH